MQDLIKFRLSENVGYLSLVRIQLSAAGSDLAIRDCQRDLWEETLRESEWR